MGTFVAADAQRGASDGRMNTRHVGLAQTAVHGTIWIAASRGLSTPLQLVILAVLARLLLPEDFGLFAMVVLVIDFMSTIGEWGIKSAVISRRDLTDTDLSTLFWLQVGSGVLLAGLTFFLAPLVAGMYREPRLTHLTRLIAPWSVFLTFGMIPMGLLEKRLDFRRVAFLEMLALLLAAVGSITMAVRGWGVLSLISLSMGSGGLLSVFAFVTTGWVPRFRFRPAALRQVVRFGLNLTGNSILNYLTNQMVSLLIGRYLGVKMLGYYALSTRITLYPVMAVVGVVRRVLFPILASIQCDSDRMRKGFLRAVSCISVVTFPALGALFVSAPDVVTEVLGDQWRPLIPLVRVFCLVGVVQSAQGIIGPLFLTLDRTGWLLGLNMLNLPLTVIALGVGLRWGLHGVALASLMASCIIGIASLGVMSRVLKLSAGGFLTALAWPTVSLVAVATGVALARQLAGAEDTGVINRLILELVIGGLAGALILWIGKAPVLIDLIGAYREVVGRVSMHPRA